MFSSITYYIEIVIQLWFSKMIETIMQPVAVLALHRHGVFKIELRCKYVFHEHLHDKHILTTIFAYSVHYKLMYISHA